MVRVWPQSISSVPLCDAYEQATGNRLKRSPSPTSGPAKVRRRAGKRPDVITATWLFSSYSEFEEFADWVDNVQTGLAGGAYAFDWTHPLSNKILRCRIVPASDDALYTVTPHQTADTAFIVQLTLEVLS